METIIKKVNYYRKLYFALSALIFISLNLIVLIVFPFVIILDFFTIIIIISSTLFMAGGVYSYMMKTKEDLIFKTRIPILNLELEKFKYNEILNVLSDFDFKQSDTPLEYYYFKGMSYHGIERYIESIPNLNQAIYLLKNSKEEYEKSLLENLLLKRGESLLKLNKVKEAEKDFQELIIMNPDFINAVYEIKNNSNS